MPRMRSASWPLSQDDVTTITHESRPRCGASRASGRARMTPDERASLRAEMVALYVAIARDVAQPPLVRMQAAAHLLERISTTPSTASCRINPSLDARRCARAASR